MEVGAHGKEYTNLTRQDVLKAAAVVALFLSPELRELVISTLYHLGEGASVASNSN